MSQSNRILVDTLRHVETPEGVELILRTAGPIARAQAYILDFVFRFILFIVFAFVLGVLGKTGNGIFLIFVFLIEWFYPVLFEVLKQGKTPGKRVMNIAVVRDDGRPLDWTSSIIRNFLRFADFLPFLYFFGTISMVLQKDFKRLGDLAAGTVVVYTDLVGVGRLLPDELPLQPPMNLSLVEQRAIVAFAERTDLLSIERQKELTELITPIIGKQDSSKNLIAMARWIVGFRSEN